MYTNKNKKMGFTLVEGVTIVFIVSILVLILVNLTKILVIEKKLYTNMILFNNKTRFVFLKIQKNLKNSLEYKILNRTSGIYLNLDYSSNGRKEGNILVIKYGVKKREKFINKAQIYHLIYNDFISIKGEFVGDMIIIEKGTRESIIDNFFGKFYLKEYGVSLKGKVGIYEFKNNFKD